MAETQGTNIGSAEGTSLGSILNTVAGILVPPYGLAMLARKFSDQRTQQSQRTQQLGSALLAAGGALAEQGQPIDEVLGGLKGLGYTKDQITAAQNLLTAQSNIGQSDIGVQLRKAIGEQLGGPVSSQVSPEQSPFGGHTESRPVTSPEILKRFEGLPPEQQALINPNAGAATQRLGAGRLAGAQATTAEATRSVDLDISRSKVAEIKAHAQALLDNATAGLEQSQAALENAATGTINAATARQRVALEQANDTARNNLLEMQNKVQVLQIGMAGLGNGLTGEETQQFQDAILKGTPVPKGIQRRFPQDTKAILDQLSQHQSVIGDLTKQGNELVREAGQNQASAGNKIGSGAYISRAESLNRQVAARVLQASRLVASTTGQPENEAEIIKQLQEVLIAVDPATGEVGTLSQMSRKVTDLGKLAGIPTNLLPFIQKAESQKVMEEIRSRASTTAPPPPETPPPPSRNVPQILKNKPLLEPNSSSPKSEDAFLTLKAQRLGLQGNQVSEFLRLKREKLDDADAYNQANRVPKK